MKILITGGTGFIGRHLVEWWKEKGREITVLSRKTDAAFFDSNTGCLDVDITVKEAIQSAIIFMLPDVVIHCAAMSKPNDCELNKEQCYLTNVMATSYITEACKTVGAKLIFLSTDFVFGHHGPYSEADNYDPVNYYGGSKVLAEKIIQNSGALYAIVRTVLVYGKKLHGQANTFLHWVKDNLEAGKIIRLYTDQQRTAVYVNDLCSGIDAILQTHFSGTVHLCGEEIFTPYSMAQQVADYFGYDKNLLQPVTRKQQPEAAIRPEKAMLKTDKAKAVLHYTATPLSMALPQIFNDKQAKAE